MFGDDYNSKRHFYIFKCWKAYKLGVTINVGERLWNLDAGCPKPIRLIYKIKSPYSFYIETYWHGFFAEKKLKREWFKLTEEDIFLIKTESPKIANKEFLQNNYDKMYQKYLQCGYYQGKNVPHVKGLENM